ncbi:MAG: TonB-dependent receptor [Bacteroidota bacterium]
MNPWKSYISLFLACQLYSLQAQPDSLRQKQELFSLSAEDIKRDRSLVDSRLNRKTSTATQTEQFASDAPATVYVVSREQIRNRGYENLLDILEDIPEVEIQRYGSPEFNQHISLRGVAGNEKFIILQDGIRISAPTDDTHSVGYNFPVVHAEQVEVILGPASALYGADAFSGVIQIISQKDATASNEVKASWGRFNTTHNSFRYAKDFRDLSFSASGIYYHSDEPNFSRFYPSDFNWYNKKYQPEGLMLLNPFSSIAVPVNIEGEDRAFEMPTDAWALNLRMDFKDFSLTYSRSYDSYCTCGSTRPEYALYSTESRFAYFIETISGRHRYRSRNLKWKLESTFSLHTYQLDNSTAFVNTYTSYQPGYKMEFGKSKKWQERLQYKLGSRGDMIAGFSYEVLDDLPLTGDLPKPFSFDQAADLQGHYYLGSNVTDKEGNDLSIAQDFFYLHYENYGAFAQLQLKPNSQINLTAGIRYDQNTRYGQAINPRLGLVWKANEDLSFKMLYGEALLSPSPRKSDQHFGSFFPVTNDQGEITGLGSNFFHLANPDLEPEKLRSLEGNVRYLLSNNIVFSINAYYTRVNNLINKFAQNTEINSFKGVAVAFVETGKNEGEALIYGTSARIEAVYELPDALDLNFYMSYSFSDGNSNGEQLLFNARHHVKAGMEINHKKFSLSPRLSYRSTSFGSLKDDDGSAIGSPPFSLLNVFGRYKIWQKNTQELSAFVKINNLLDVRYYNVFIGGAEGFSQVPQRPLTWTIGASFNW